MPLISQCFLSPLLVSFVSPGWCVLVVDMFQDLGVELFNKEQKEDAAEAALGVVDLSEDEDLSEDDDEDEILQWKGDEDDKLPNSVVAEFGRLCLFSLFPMHTHIHIYT